MKKIILFALLALPLLLIYRNWIFAPEIIGGDWPYFYQENINSFSFLPLAWNSVLGDGFGGPHVVYSLDSYLYFSGWFFSNVLHIPWPIVYKIFWFGLVIFLSIFSITHLMKQLKLSIPLYFSIPGMYLYTANTYILMVLGGGQLGVGLGYAIAPLVLSTFMAMVNLYQSLEKNHTSKLWLSLMAGFVLSIQILFDFRIAYITLIAISIYFLLHLPKNYSLFLYYFLVPLVVVGLIHAFWLLPFVFIGQSSAEQLGAAYTSTESLRFFSFALFENAFGLLHPNWPENIFGKVGFMKPEFLFLPLIVFSCLLFIESKLLNKTQKKSIIFFIFIALVGIFLAKGANDPFGEVSIWLFENLPGFVMFRDPTKWYTLIAISYSVLLPFSLFSIYQFYKSKFKIQKSKQFKIHKYLPLTFYILFVIYLIILIRPAVMGDLGGTFRNRTVPAEYVALKNTLLEDRNFSRVLWIPKFQRFGFNNQEHPAIEASSIFKATNSADMVKEMNKTGTEKKLSGLSIKYVIIPFDSEQELFLKDRKFNNIELINLEKSLDKISWLQKDKSFNNLTVYKLNNSKDRLYLINEGSIFYNKNTPTNYSVKIRSQQNNTLVFNESYSPHWKIKIDGKEFESNKYNEVNSFELNRLNSEVTLYYNHERYYILGRVISIITLLSIIGFFLVRKYQYK